MNRKSLLSILAVAAALLLLTGCGEKSAHLKSEEIPLADTETSAAPSKVETFPDAAPVAENQFVFTRNNFPRLDGSAPTVPLGQAIASVLLGESRDEVSDFIHFSKTGRAYRALMNGEADILLAAEPSPSVWAEQDDGGYDWDMSPFAVDALVFFVSAANPVDGLTREQLRGVYAGEIANWAEVGGENLQIAAFQRDEEAGSQTAMQNLVMLGEPMTDAPKELVRGETGDVAAFEDSPAAIGYALYYSAHNMGAADGLKILSVDGVAPDAETIRSGAYPFLTRYYVVTNAGRRADDPAKLLYDWILSADGQRLVAHEGYAPIMEIGGDEP